MEKNSKRNTRSPHSRYRLGSQTVISPQSGLLPLTVEADASNCSPCPSPRSNVPIPCLSPLPPTPGPVPCCYASPPDDALSHTPPVPFLVLSILIVMRSPPIASHPASYTTVPYSISHLPTPPSFVRSPGTAHACRHFLSEQISSGGTVGLWSRVCSNSLRFSVYTFTHSSNGEPRYEPLARSSGVLYLDLASRRD